MSWTMSTTASIADASADAAVGDGEHDGDEPGDRRPDERDVGAEERDHEDRRHLRDAEHEGADGDQRGVDGWRWRFVR